MKTVIVVNGIVSARDAFGVFEAEHFAFQKKPAGRRSRSRGEKCKGLEVQTALPPEIKIQGMLPRAHGDRYEVHLPLAVVHLQLAFSYAVAARFIEAHCQRAEEAASQLDGKEVRVKEPEVFEADLRAVLNPLDKDRPCYRCGN